MRDYDILFILKPHLGDDTYKELVDQFQNWINKHQGNVHFVTPQGVRDLPATFKKYTSGYFVHAQFQATPKTLTEVKQRMKVNENFVRYLIVDLKSITPRKEKELVKSE